jgi:hypothetical protein
MKKFLYISTLLILLMSNILSITWGAFNAALSTAFATVSGIETLTTKRNKSVKKYGNKIVKRTARTTAKSIASIPLESLPYIGVATILTVTAYEIKSACDNKKDMDSLYSELGFLDNEETSAFDDVCNLKTPSKEDILSKLPSKADINDKVNLLKTKIEMMKNNAFE